MKKSVLVSAADCVTAKLVEQAGFDGIWVSGLEASTRLGLPDNGSISMTEMLNIVKPIVQAVKIPVWVDVDTGYGNFARTVKEFELIGATGVCVQDDEEGQKTNSLWGGKTPLMSKEKFGDKLNSAGAWDDRKIKIMARTETLIRGGTIEDAWDRMAYYLHCGADVVLPHVRSSDKIVVPNNGTLYAIVPTKFPQYTNQKLFDMGYSMVIWANQTERVKIKSTRDALKIMKDDDCAKTVEDSLSATLDEMKGLVP